MRFGTSRPSALRTLLACSTVALYVIGVAVLPAAHGAVEMVRTDRSLEAEHSADCPTLHAGAVCTAIAGLGTGQPTGAPSRIHDRRTMLVDAPVTADQATPAPPSRRTAARGPPQT